MRPESRYELNQLVEMLQENTQYEIMIYGHTNGKNAGPIITLQDDSKGYFSKSVPTNTKNGSAKKLSQERASIISKYLINQGIGESRMQAKGMGGKDGIYKKLDPLAYLNVRVEIEILVD
jgi:outer membrane protein OmpA-like peptidoglycan-associated protein